MYHSFFFCFFFFVALVLWKTSASSLYIFVVVKLCALGPPSFPIASDKAKCETVSVHLLISPRRRFNNTGRAMFRSVRLIFSRFSSFPSFFFSFFRSFSFHLLYSFHSVCLSVSHLILSFYFLARSSPLTISVSFAIFFRSFSFLYSSSLFPPSLNSSSLFLSLSLSLTHSKSLLPLFLSLSLSSLSPPT